MLWKRQIVGTNSYELSIIQSCLPIMSLLGPDKKWRYREFDAIWSHDYMTFSTDIGKGNWHIYSILLRLRLPSIFECLQLFIRYNMFNAALYRKDIHLEICDWRGKWMNFLLLEENDVIWSHKSMEKTIWDWQIVTL